MFSFSLSILLESTVPGVTIRMTSPLYKTFRSGRIFCLFTDGDLVSLFDEPRDIGVFAG